MSLPDRSRTSLILGAMASVVIPFVTFIYAEQQKTQEKIRQESSRKRTESIAQIERDKAHALEIQQRLLTGFLSSDGKIKNREFCSYVKSQVMASTDGLLGTYALRTFQNTMESEIAGPDNDTQRTLWCECSEQHRRLGEILTQSAPSLIKMGFPPQDLIYIQNRLSPKNLRCGDTERSTPLSPPGPTPAPKPVRACPEKNFDFMKSFSGIKPRIYIQVSSDAVDQKAIARNLNQNLQDLYGYKILDIETVNAGRSPSKPQLRYFDAEGEKISEEILKQVNTALSCTGVNAEVLNKYNFDLANFSRVRGKMRPYHFELWFPAERPIN